MLSPASRHLATSLSSSALKCQQQQQRQIATAGRLFGKKQRQKQRSKKAVEEPPSPAFHQWRAPEGRDTGFVVSNFYGSLGKKGSRNLVPLVATGPHLSWYACGPTVYDSCHVGHASSYLRFDLIRRILQRHGEDVHMVMGVTDVDDKIIARAGLLEREFLSLAGQYEREFYSDLAAMNILPPDAFARVSDIIPEIIAFVKRLIERRQAYVCASGSVWFDHRCLAGDPSFLMLPYEEWDDTGSVGGGEKRSTRDFALWKTAKDGEPYWEAPWGNGRPGWHIECSTIASLYFGGRLDVHSGAKDLNLHHECEICQCSAYHAEALTDAGAAQWCNYFMHSGHLQVPGAQAKMSKSFGSVVTIGEYARQHSPDALRLMCAQRHWTDDVAYTKKVVGAANKRLLTWRRLLRRCQQYVHGNMAERRAEPAVLLRALDECRRDVDAAFRHDFDVKTALEHVDALDAAVTAELGDEVDLDTWREPATGRRESSDAVIAVMRYVTKLFADLGFVTVNNHRRQ